MQPSGSNGILALVSSAAAILCLVGCSKADSGAKSRVRLAPQVVVAKVAARDVPVEVHAPVDLRALEQVDVGSKVLGYVDAVLVERGDRVRRGQVIALVRPSDLPDLLAAARSAFGQTKASAALARTNFQRTSKLAPSGVVSQQELQSSTAALASAESAEAAARAQIAGMAIRLGETRITSPIDGTVSVRRLDPGALVGPPGGGAIVTVVRTDCLRVFISLNERDATGVSIGKDAHVQLDALPDHAPFWGKVVRLAPSFDPLTRTLEAEVQLPNPSGELRPGMYGRGAIVLERHPNTPVVSVNAVQISSGKKYVFVLHDTKVERRAIETGAEVDDGHGLEIRSGLKAGEEVVIAGADGLSDGTTVRVVRDTNPYTGEKTTMAPANAAQPSKSNYKPPSGFQTLGNTMWLTRLALRNPILILMLSLMLIVLGVVSLNRLSVDLFPDITIPVIRIATFYAGAGPKDIEKSITQPIERAVSASPGVDRVESSSKQGVSLISVWFNYGTNLDNAQFEVSQRISQILNTLPPGIQQPFVIKFDITNIPVVSALVGSDDLDEKQLYDLAYNTIEPQLERIPGVASATVGGGKIREIEVMASRDALRARGLGILDVVSAVRSSNFLLPSGSLRAGDRDYNVFTNTQVPDVRLLRDVVVRATPAQAGQGPGLIRVSDVAQVEDLTADQTEIVRVNGKRGVFLRVLKQPGANTIAVVDAVRAAIGKLRGVPANVKVDIGFDQSLYIRSAVSALQHEAVQGGALAVLVILFFLMNVRATGIIGVAIPLSIVSTFVLLYFTNQTLNVFTLGGLALGVGRLVDDSIVELENIHRHLATGQNRRDAVLMAAQEVAMPILVSTITTIVVFFPVLFMVGIGRYLFFPLALTIAFALLMSFWVSRTVTPLLCFYWLKEGGHRPDGIAARVTGWLDRLDAGYARALQWVLAHRLLTVIGILLFFASSMMLKRGIGSEFFPESDESQISINYKTPIGTRVERTEQVTERLEKIVERELAPVGSGSSARPLYTTILSDTGLPMGRTAIFSQNTGTHAANLQVNLVTRSARPLSDVAAAEKVRAALRDSLPGTQYFFFIGGIVKRIQNIGASAPIDVEILGYDLDAGSAYAKALIPKLRSLADAKGRPLLADVQSSREENSPELNVVVDRQKAGVLGVSEQDVAQTILVSLLGNTQITPIPFLDPKTGNQYYVNVRMADADRNHVSDLGDLFVRTPNGGIVTVDTLAKVERRSGPVLIERKYLQRIVHVTANIAPDADLGSASAAVQRVVSENPAPEGFSATLGGQTLEQKKAFTGLIFAAIMALALVYMVLASQFKSLIDPLVIMFSVPLGVSGVFIMLYLTGTKLSVNSFMGIIMMVGIVVSNGVLLVDFTNVLRRRGKPLIEATVLAGRTRLRPILMTTIATVTALIPMALGIGEGSETNLPLARAVIGGLLVSTIFTLFLVPALYTVFDRFAKRVSPHDEDLGDGRKAAENPNHA